MSSNSPVHVLKDGKIARIIIDNPPVNATSRAVRAGLIQAVKDIQTCEIATLECAGRTFTAGGDIREFDTPAQEPHLPDVVAVLESSQTPVLALLHGTVMGAGWELALGCAWRVALSGTRFGLPEVNLGLIPGAGGTQRTPRLIGWEMAVSMAAKGQMIEADSLLEAGGLDAVVDHLKDIAQRYLNRPVPRAISKRDAPALDRVWLEDQRNRLKKSSKGQQSPLRALDALTWAQEPFAIGQPKERAQHLELRDSAQSKALRHIFFAERQAVKPDKIKGLNPVSPSMVAIIGGGFMGQGIAFACLKAGMTVTILEQSPAAAAQSKAGLKNLINDAQSKGRLAAARAEAMVAACLVSAGDADIAGAELVIEAVFEDMSVKQAVFRKLSSCVQDQAILATNTSYLDPCEIFAGIPHPERCLGLHFFSPAHIMTLVEVVETPQTRTDILATAFAFAKALGKVPVLSRICDGFIGNRILAAYRRSAEDMLIDGALPQDIDHAMRAFGMAMGPFAAQDLAGLQIAQANRRRQDALRPTDERCVTIADLLCDLGRFGQRVGKGWYAYPNGTRRGQRDPEVTALIEGYSAAQKIKRQTFNQAQIQSTLLAAMANEGWRIVEEGIAIDPAHVDVVKVHGYGFPSWRGGPLHSAAVLGADRIRQTLDDMQDRRPHSWVRAQHYS